MHYKCTVLVAVVTIMGHPSESQDYVLLPGLNISGGGGGAKCAFQDLLVMLK